MQQLSIIQLERKYITALQSYGLRSKQLQLMSITLIKALLAQNKYQTLMRAMNILNQLEINPELLEFKYKVYIALATYYEKEKQYGKAYELLFELMPMIQNRFGLLQVQILYHLMENARLLKQFKHNEELISLMTSVGLDMENYRKFDKNYQTILIRSYYFQALHYLRENDEGYALEMFFKTYKISEQALGELDSLTINAKNHYQELCEKLDVSLKLETEQNDEEKKSNQNVKKIKPQNYNVMISQLYCNRTRISTFKSKEQNKQNSIYSDLKKTYNSTFYKVSRPTSAKTATTKFPSPKGQSQIMFPSANLQKNKKQQQQSQNIRVTYYLDSDDVYERDPMEMMIERPFSVQKPRDPSKKEIAFLRVPTRQQIKLLSNNNIMRKQSIFSSNQLTIQQPRGSKKGFSQQDFGQQQQRISGSHRNMTVESKDKIQSVKDQSSSSSLSESASIVIRKPLETDNSSIDPIIGSFLKNHTMEELNEAVTKIVDGLRRLSLQKLLPIQETHHFKNPSPNKANGAINRQSTISIMRSRASVGFVSIMQKKIMENEHTKHLLSFFSTAFIAISYPIHFYAKLFTDQQPCLYVLDHPSFRVQCPQKYLDEEYSEDLNEIEQIQRILQNQVSTNAMQVVGSIQLSNFNRKIQIRFLIDKFASYYEDICDYENLIDLFDQLLSIYLKQEGLLFEWQDHYQPQLLITSNEQEYSQYLLSKVLFLLNHKKYVRAMNGYKFKQSGPTIQYDKLDQNNSIYLQKKEYLRNLLSSNLDIKLDKQSTKKQKKKQRRQLKEKAVQLLTPYPSSEDDNQSSSQPYSSNYSQKGLLLQNDALSKNSFMVGDSPAIQIPKRRQTRRISTKVFSPQFEDESYTPQQLQDYLSRYFPEFKIGEPYEYHPQPGPLPKLYHFPYDYYYYPPKKVEKVQFQPYNIIYPQDFLFLVKIFKIDRSFYYVKLNDKLFIQQINLKNIWTDEIEVNLKDLIDYKIGRSGYIFNILKLEAELQKRIIIRNCKLSLKLTDKKIQAQEPQQEQMEAQILNGDRNYIKDIFFLLQFNKRVQTPLTEKDYKSNQLEFNSGYVQMKQSTPPKHAKRLIRITLSHEEINKHISRTNERTILLNDQDIHLFHNYNSILMLKKQYITKNAKLVIQSKNLINDFKEGILRGKLILYDKKYFTCYLNQEKLEPLIHLLNNEQAINNYLLNYRLILNKTLNGKQLNQNQDRKSVSKEWKYLLLQRNCKYQESFHYSQIQQVGNVFISISALKQQNLYTFTVMPQKTRSKSHIFITNNPNYQNLILTDTHTYQRLEQQQITKNIIKSKYHICNIFYDQRILIAQKQNTRVVYKSVYKYAKTYLIITVVLIQKSFQIYFYNQQNCRQFYFRIHQSDFVNMSQEFLDSIFPQQNQEIIEQLFRPWRLQEINKIYEVMRRSPDLFRTKTNRLMRAIREKTYVHTTQSNQPKKQMSRSSTQEYGIPSYKVRHNTMMLPSIQFIDDYNSVCWLYTILIRDKGSMFEKKLWDEILKQISIMNNVVYLNNFNIQIQELVFWHERNFNFLCYIPCTDINQSFRWQPVRARVYRYENYQTVDIPLNFRGKQLGLQKQCQSLFIQYMKDKSLPSTQDYVKVNKSNDKQFQDNGYQLLYKGIFTIAMRLFISIFRKKEKIIIKIWKMNQSITKKFSFQTIELKIPYIRQLLEISPNEAGRRIQLTYRNQLLNAAFLNF